MISAVVTITQPYDGGNGGRASLVWVDGDQFSEEGTSKLRPEWEVWKKRRSRPSWDRTDLNINSTPVTTGTFLPIRYTKLIFSSQTYHDLKWSDLFAYLFSACTPSLDYCLHVGWRETCPKICGPGQEYKRKLIYCQTKRLKVINQANALSTRKCYNLQLWHKNIYNDKGKNVFMWMKDCKMWEVTALNYYHTCLGAVLTGWWFWLNNKDIYSWYISHIFSP